MSSLSSPVSARARLGRLRLRLTSSRVLLLVFFASLPFVNPVVHGDGVGYYAYARAPLIQHNLRFEEDWRRANLAFVQLHTSSDGRVDPNQYAPTGYIANVFSIGPALLWTPFLLLAHAAVLLSDALGAHLAPDGFSLPYRLAMALGTAIYGFLGLWLSFSIARQYVLEKWALLATLGIWFATSLPVYMYFNPAWSHAHSVFAVALFLWYWRRTRSSRSLSQWALLGLIAGLMLDVYFPNGVFLLLPLLDAVRSYASHLRPLNSAALLRQFAANCLFLLLIAISVLPTLITRRIVFGSFFRFGSYGGVPWHWNAPFWRDVLFSSDHGLLSWTPLLILALAGLLLGLLDHRSRSVAACFALVSAAFYYVFSSYPYWDGMASFGNRFFLSLTPIFVFGLAILFQRVDLRLRSPRWLLISAAALLALFALWNAGLIYQWGAHLIPARGPVSFRDVAYNQIFVVPRQLGAQARVYLFRRSDLMRQIEQRDIDQLSAPSPSN
jgi:hypothetical protein